MNKVSEKLSCAALQKVRCLCFWALQIMFSAISESADFVCAIRLEVVPDMEGNLQNSSKLGCPVDDFDTKYISGLGLEENVGRLQEELRLNRSWRSVKKRRNCFLIELKASEIMAEKKKRRDVIDASKG
ncbi:hypothetical protein Q3G72_028757 [Acer saccharum]|nr:hypothetical protein Q3G72_028757 [Acer saccharum]